MTLKDIQRYKTIVFDCDGVLLNSNTVKTQAFYNAALPYGEKAARRLVDYHLQHGGISRYSKFEYFQREIMAQPHDPDVSNHLLKLFATEVRKGLLTCELAEGLNEIRELSQNTRWLVVSGGDQRELRDVFAIRGIDRFFDGGIFGSPDDKDKILNRELVRRNIKLPAIFFGDSKYDYNAAITAEIDFIFVRAWSEISLFTFENINVSSIYKLTDLLKKIK